MKINLIFLLFFLFSLNLAAAKDLSKYSDREIIALTLLMEARGEEELKDEDNFPIMGMRLVAQIIKNRVISDKYPDKAREVCLQRRQFSCWNSIREGDYYDKLLDHYLAGRAKYYAGLVLRGEGQKTVINVIDNRIKLSYVHFSSSRAVVWFNSRDHMKFGNHYFY